jgi:hypothetical protein
MKGGKLFEKFPLKTYPVVILEIPQNYTHSYPHRRIYPLKKEKLSTFFG